MEQQQTQTVVNTGQTNIVTTPVVKQNNTLVIILSILLLISVSTSGFFAYQTQMLVKELTELKKTSNPIELNDTMQTQTPVATSSSEVDPTANWKTYTNEKYGFSFKYPKEYIVNQNSNPTVENSKIMELTNSGGVMFYINLGYLSDGIDKPDVKFDYENVTINGKDFKKQTIYTANVINQISYQFKIKNESFTMSSGDIPLINQIISTFKFTN